MKTTYIRFVVGTNLEKPTRQAGVVCCLEAMRKEGKLPDYEAAHVLEIFEWINTHLPFPPFSRKDWSPDAISWFKGSAQTMIGKFRELIAILEQYDVPVQMLRTERPGMILYEDEFQVIAQSRHF